MNCSEARQLFGRGVRPGSASPERAQLGFHLAACPDCQAYQATDQDDLLASLLLQPAHAPPAPAPTPVPRPAIPAAHGGWQRRRARIEQALWYLSLATLAAFVVGVASIVGWATLSVFHTHRNVQAMIVPTTTEQPAALPSAAPPATAAPTPTAGATTTPTPTAGATTTPTPPPPTATLRPTATPAPSATPAPPPAGAPITVLLLGSDQRPGERASARTDAIIVARIDPARQRVALLSLPRDLIVQVPGYGQTRINAAHVWGIIYNDPAGGIGLARKAVGNLLGIPIDYAMLINFEGFIGAIDAIGGIDVDVVKELYDTQFPTMDYGYTVAHFLPGRQHMDGATALMYSRIRHPDSDFERLRRQQDVLVGILARLRDQNMLHRLTSVEDLTAALRGYVQTDIPEARMVGLAWALRDTAPDQVERYLLDQTMVSFGIGDDRYAEVALPGTIETLVRQLLGQ